MTTDQNRTHCRIDLHRVDEGTMTPADFHSRWGTMIDAIMLESPMTDDEIEAINNKVGDAEDRTDEIKKAANEALDELRQAVREITATLNTLDNAI